MGKFILINKCLYLIFLFKNLSPVRCTNGILDTTVQFYTSKHRNIQKG